MSAASTPGKMVHHALMGTILVGFRDESIFHCGLGLRHGNALDEQCENARRLVAAWNACDGVPTEVLEANAAGGLPWNFADQIDALAQRDALLAALTELVACKNLKDEESRMRHRRECSVQRSFDKVRIVNAMRDDYNRRKPLAWAAAYAAILKVWKAAA